MPGYADIHCHPVPGIDDGAKTAADGAALLAGLARLGFDRVVATPHIRSGVWDNRRATIEPALRELHAAIEVSRAAGTAFPRLDIAAEHLLDDVVWDLFERNEAMPYPLGTSALFEFQYDSIPYRVEMRLWRLKKRGITPVLAHPERYGELLRNPDRLQDLIGAGARPLLDIMSLVGHYGRSAQSAAEANLRVGAYAAACTDSHKSSDLEPVAEALALLRRIAGDEEFARLMITGPRELLGESAESLTPR